MSDSPAKSKAANPAAEDPLAPPTNVRFGILAFSVSMSVLFYLDRFALAVAQPTLMKEMDLNKEQMGVVTGAFFYAYALAQMPAGWLSDRFGARITMTLYVFFWSLAVAALGLSWGLVSLIVFRTLLGLAQAGAYPCAASYNKHWFPPHRRGFANSMVAMGGRAGAMLADAVTPLLMVAVGALIGWTTGQWRIVFALYGLIGVLWCFGFWSFFRNRPDEHPRCNAAEAEFILSGVKPDPEVKSYAPPFAAMLTSPTVLLMCSISIFVNVGWIFLVTFLPTYLKEIHELDLRVVGLLAALPKAASMLGGVCGGNATDWLARRFGLNWGRRLTGVIATGGASLAYLALLGTDNLVIKVALFAAVGFLIDFGLGSIWAVYQDIAGRHVATVLGFGNMCGNLAAGFFPMFIGRFADKNEWKTVFVISAAALLVTMTCWFFINPSRKLADNQA